MNDPNSPHQQPQQQPQQPHQQPQQPQQSAHTAPPVAPAAPAPAAPAWTAVGTAADWPVNGGRVVKVGARRIGVYHHAEKWYALKDMCPHAGVSLAQGPVQDQQVMCVGHGWLFSLLTGEVTRGPTGVKVATYPVRITQGAIEIEV